ncbi:hypothetical protein GC176_00105 [bacterium]|nr:hypothetical protein [bacterium]
MTERSGEGRAPAKPLSMAERLMRAVNSYQPGKPKSEIVDEYIERLNAASREELLQELRNAIAADSATSDGFSCVWLRALMVRDQLDGSSVWNDALIPDLRDECRRFFVTVSYGLRIPGVKDLIRTIRVERNSHPDTTESTKIGGEFVPINELSAVESLFQFTMNLLGSVNSAIDDSEKLTDLQRLLSHTKWDDVKKCEDAAKQEILRFEVAMLAAARQQNRATDEHTGGELADVTTSNDDASNETDTDDNAGETAELIQAATEEPPAGYRQAKHEKGNPLGPLVGTRAQLGFVFSGGRKLNLGQYRRHFKSQLKSGKVWAKERPDGKIDAFIRSTGSNSTDDKLLTTHQELLANCIQSGAASTNARSRALTGADARDLDNDRPE